MIPEILNSKIRPEPSSHHTIEGVCISIRIQQTDFLTRSFKMDHENILGSRVSIIKLKAPALPGKVYFTHWEHQVLRLHGSDTDRAQRKLILEAELSGVLEDLAATR